MQIRDPSAIAKDKYISLFLKARRFGPLEHLPLVENLEGVDTVGSLHLDDADLTKGTTSDHLEDLEVIFAQPKFFHSSGHRFYCNKNSQK